MDNHDGAKVYGGIGSDLIYGADAMDNLIGDADVIRAPMASTLVAGDLTGGDDTIKGYGGDDLI